MKFTDGKVIVQFEDNVLLHFEEYRQMECSDLEAGGQLFIKNINNKKELLICKATGPKKSDARGIRFFDINMRLAKIEIKRYYEKGLYFVGDWHTHPQDEPVPSSLDIESIQDCCTKSEPSRDFKVNFLVMVIVGRADFPDGLSVSLNYKKKHIILKPTEV